MTTPGNHPKSCYCDECVPDGAPGKGLLAKVADYVWDLSDLPESTDTPEEALERWLR